MAIREIVLKDPKVIKTFTHPICGKVFITMRRFGQPMTVKMIADALDMKHGNVFYHVKKLVDIDLLRVERTESINGIIAKYYVRNYDHVHISTAFKNDSPYQHFQFVNTMFKERLNDYLLQIHPPEVTLDDTKSADDFMRLGDYQFDPDDLQKIEEEIITVFQKYHKETTHSKHYIALVSAGQHRNKLYKLLDDNNQKNK